MELEDLQLGLVREDLFNRLVYLVGPTRSGTSIISAAIGAHPKHLVAAWASYFMDRVWCHARKAPTSVLRTKYEAIPGYRGEAAARALDPLRRVALEQYVAESFEKPRLARLFGLLPLFTLLAGDHGKDPRKLHCWQTKSCNWRGLDAIRRSFPEAVFVFIFRDPRGSILSGARRASREVLGRECAQVLDSEIIDFALYWRTVVAVCLRFARRHPECSILLRFEDFLVDPVRQLNRVFERTLGEPMGATSIRAALAELQGGASNDPEERYQGLSAAPLDRWRRQLTADQAELIAALTWKAARSAGYDVPPPIKAPPLSALVGTMPGWKRKLRVLAKLVLLWTIERTLMGRRSDGPPMGWRAEAGVGTPSGGMAGLTAGELSGKRCFRVRRLFAECPGVPAVGAQQGFVAAALADAAVNENDDLIGLGDRSEVMADHDDRDLSPAAERQQSLAE